MTRNQTVPLVLALGCAALAAPAPNAPTNACTPEGVCTLPAAAAPAAAPAAKHLWANSFLYADAPPFEGLTWLADKPELEGKFVVVEFWRTWCGACKRMTPLMNALHEKFGDELVVVGITGETEAAVRAYAGPKKSYAVALDAPLAAEGPAASAPAPAGCGAAAAGGPDQGSATAQRQPDQGRYEARFGVWGWPHVLILEPQYRTVVWEGFPGLKGFELTEAKVAKILAIGRQLKAEEAARKKSKPE